MLRASYIIHYNQKETLNGPNRDSKGNGLWQEIREKADKRREWDRTEK